jgi:hypothetical protein
MKTIKMEMTRNQGCQEIVEIIRDAWTDGGQARSIGITEDGRIDWWYESHDASNMAVFIESAGNEWTYGDVDGDPSDKSTWTEDLIACLVAAFDEDWLCNAEYYNTGDNYEIEWKKPKK